MSAKLYREIIKFIEFQSAVIKSFERSKSKDKKMLLDYITNLRQENERLKNRIEEITKIYQNESRYRTDLETKYVQLQQENENSKKLKERYQLEKEVYKSRIDKAIEFVETNPLTWKPNMDLTKLIENPNLKDKMFYTPDEWLHQLHIILKGDDKNEK